MEKIFQHGNRDLGNQASPPFHKHMEILQRWGEILENRASAVNWAPMNRPLIECIQKRAIPI